MTEYFFFFGDRNLRLVFQGNENILSKREDIELFGKRELNTLGFFSNYYQLSIDQPLGEQHVDRNFVNVSKYKTVYVQFDGEWYSVPYFTTLPFISIIKSTLLLLGEKCPSKRPEDYVIKVNGEMEVNNDDVIHYEGLKNVLVLEYHPQREGKYPPYIVPCDVINSVHPRNNNPPPQQPSALPPQQPSFVPQQPSVVVRQQPPSLHQQPPVVPPQSTFLPPQQPSVVPQQPSVVVRQQPPSLPQQPSVVPQQPSVVVRQQPPSLPQQSPALPPQSTFLPPQQPPSLPPSSPLFPQQQSLFRSQKSQYPLPVMMTQPPVVNGSTVVRPPLDSSLNISQIPSVPPVGTPINMSIQLPNNSIPSNETGFDQSTRSVVTSLPSIVQPPSIVNSPLPIDPVPEGAIPLPFPLPSGPLTPPNNNAMPPLPSASVTTSIPNEVPQYPPPVPFQGNPINQSNPYSNDFGTDPTSNPIPIIASPTENCLRVKGRYGETKVMIEPSTTVYRIISTYYYNGTGKSLRNATNSLRVHLDGSDMPLGMDTVLGDVGIKEGDVIVIEGL